MIFSTKHMNSAIGVIMESGSELLRFILHSWPQLESRIQPELQFFKMTRLVMLVSNLRVPVWRWTFTRGGELFQGEEVPDSYIACGIQSRGSPEYLLLMWREKERRFWFSDMYVNIYFGEDFINQVSMNLDLALEKWEAGDQIVVFSKEWGWFDPHSQRFERDTQDPRLAVQILEAEDLLKDRIWKSEWTFNDGD